MGFSKVFKGNIGGGRAAECVTFFCLVGGEVTGGVPGISIISLLVPTSLGSTSFCLAWDYHPPPGWGPQVLQKLCIRLLCTSPKEDPGPCPLLYDCFLTAFPLFLHSHTSLIIDCLNLPFGTQGRPRRLKPFSSKQETGDTEILLYLGGPHSVLLSFICTWGKLEPYPSEAKWE